MQNNKKKTMRSKGKVQVRNHRRAANGATAPIPKGAEKFVDDYFERIASEHLSPASFRKWLFGQVPLNVEAIDPSCADAVSEYVSQFTSIKRRLPHRKGWAGEMASLGTAVARLIQIHDRVYFNLGVAFGLRLKDIAQRRACIVPK